MAYIAHSFDILRTRYQWTVRVGLLFYSAMKSSNVRSIQIALEDPGQPEIITLIRAGEQYSAQLYPTESNHHLALDALRDSNVRFFVSRDGGRAVATGALVLHGSWAELKAMWVVPDAR